MNYDSSIFRLEKVWAPPQLDLVVNINGLTIYFLGVYENAWCNIHFLVGKKECLHHEIVKFTTVLIFRSS